MDILIHTHMAELITLRDFYDIAVYEENIIRAVHYNIPLLCTKSRDFVYMLVKQRAWVQLLIHDIVANKLVNLNPDGTWLTVQYLPEFNKIDHVLHLLFV